MSTLIWIAAIVNIAETHAMRPFQVSPPDQTMVIVREICTDMEILCLEKELRLKRVLTDNPQVRADKNSLRQLVANLLSNTIRYTPPGGKITVSVHIQTGMALLTVEDTGIRIPPKDLSYIFERFYRVDKARSISEGGSGLGLAICKHIADIHNGEISVASEIDKKSAFVFKLPLAHKPL